MAAITNQILSNIEVDIVDQLTTNTPIKTKYTDLYAKLRKFYMKDNKLGITAFEYFDGCKTIVKPHFDVDLVLTKFDSQKATEIKQNFIRIANSLMNVTTEEWAVSEDTRFVDHKEKDPNTGKYKQIQRYKISFHFVLWTKKCNFEKFGYWVKDKVTVFNENDVSGVDLAIYRHGINKFRLPMTKKSPNDFESLLIPHNYTELDDFHKHIVQITEDCTEFEINLPAYVYSLPLSTKDKIQRQIYSSNSKAQEEIESIISSYKIISTKHGTNDYQGTILYDIASKECGYDHKHNHNYLIHNTDYNTLKLKCHSQKCTNFEKILYEQKVGTLHFDMDYFLNIPIPHGKKDNYLEVKKYFEQFFIFIRDSNSYYRKRYEYNQKYQYYEQEMKPINIGGYKDFFYKMIKDDAKSDIEDETNSIKLCNFFKRYDLDTKKKNYYGLSFQPYGIHTHTNKLENGDFNLFEGFNYRTVLPHYEKTHIPDEKKDNFHFFLQYIKFHICGLSGAKKSKNNDQIQLAKHSFDYLMYYLANIIQNPTLVPHIIMIFYSKVHGTGKSGFTKFIANVIGQNLCYFGSYDQIMETHTNAHVGKLMNVIEEVDLHASRKYHNSMKDFSQRDRAVYNEKHKPQFNIKTFVRYFKTTNYQDGVWFDNEDRRYVLYTFDKIQDTGYIKNLLNIMEDPYTVYLFGDYLANIQIPYQKLNDWEINRPLNADYYIMRTEDPITEFIRDLLKLEAIDLDHLSFWEYFNLLEINSEMYTKDMIAICKETLYHLFVRFYDENNCFNKKYKNKVQFFRHLLANFNSGIRIQKFKSKSQKDYYILSLDKLWQIVLPNEPYVNHHFYPNKPIDESIHEQ